MITRWRTPEGGRIDLIHLEDRGWHLLVRHPASGVVITDIALGVEVPHDDLKTALEAVDACPRSPAAGHAREPRRGRRIRPWLESHTTPLQPQLTGAGSRRPTGTRQALRRA